MKEETNREPFDFNAYRRKHRKDDPEGDLEQRKRDAVSLLERTGCLVNGVMVKYPRPPKK